jgi:hypothetical protein
MPARSKRPASSVRRRIEFDSATWYALHQLSLDRMRSLQEHSVICSKKHRRPTTLKEMLQASARSHPANDPHPPRKLRSS